MEWALASSEWIRFDTEDTGNKDGMGGVHPYGAGMDDHTIHYCYYQSKLGTPLFRTRSFGSSRCFELMLAPLVFESFYFSSFSNLVISNTPHLRPNFSFP